MTHGEFRGRLWSDGSIGLPLLPFIRQDKRITQRSFPLRKNKGTGVMQIIPQRLL